MTFEEIPLYEAIHDVYRMVDSPRADHWQRPPFNERLCRQIQACLPIGSPFLMEQMLVAWSLYGKSAAVADGIRKLELSVFVARAHGRQCFWANRGRGECSTEVQLDRLLPGGPYCVENCVIACAFHNGQRGDRSVEAYLACHNTPLWPERRSGEAHA